MSEPDPSQITDLLLGMDFPITEYEEDDVLIEEDSVGETVFVLYEGEVAVTQYYREIATINQPGAMLGEIAAVLGVPRTATITVTKPSRFFVIEDLLEFLSDNPIMAVVILKGMAFQILERDKYHSGIYVGLRRLREKDAEAEHEEKLTANAGRKTKAGLRKKTAAGLRRKTKAGLRRKTILKRRD